MMISVLLRRVGRSVTLTPREEFYKKSAVKPALPHAFLMTDGQIADEKFLVYINDMLSSGNRGHTERPHPQ